MKKYCSFIIALIIKSVVCIGQTVQLIDANATPETKALYYNLHKLSKDHILFGHQHATEYGHGWSGEDNRSDVKSITGSHPAVIGVDFSGLSGRSETEIENNKISLAKNIAATYDRGGITTVSWHFNNPASAGGFYWKDSVSAPAVKYMIPGGAYNEKYKSILQTIGTLAKSIKGRDGKQVPMIFRPYHEFDGDWFWWGAKHCTAQQYKELFQYTVTYLRDTKGLHNVLFAWSPDRLFTNETEYLSRYPGNDYVDVLGMDNYYDLETAAGILTASNKLKIISDYAVRYNKIAALTEMGKKNLTQSDWYTEVLLKALTQQKVEISYALAWANNSSAFWTPYSGHAATADFIKFKNSSSIVFGDNIPKMYEIK